MRIDQKSEGEGETSVLISQKTARILRVTKRAAEYRRRQIKKMDALGLPASDLSRFLKDSERYEAEILRLIQGERDLAGQIFQQIFQENRTAILSFEGIDFLRQELDSLDLVNSETKVQATLSRGEGILEKGSEEDLKHFAEELQDIERENLTRLEQASSLWDFLREVFMIAEEREKLLHRMEDWTLECLTLFQRNPGVSWRKLTPEDQTELTRLQREFEDVLIDLTEWETQVKELGEKEEFQQALKILNSRFQDSILLIMSFREKMSSLKDNKSLFLADFSPSSFLFSLWREEVISEMSQNHLGIVYEKGEILIFYLRYFPAIFYQESCPVLSFLFFLPER